MFRRLLIVSFVVLASVAGTASRGACATVATGDGLAIDFRDSDAAITAIRVGQRALPLNRTPGGFFVVDMIGDRMLGKMDYRSEGFPGRRFVAGARPSPTAYALTGIRRICWRNMLRAFAAAANCAGCRRRCGTNNSSAMRSIWSRKIPG